MISDTQDVEDFQNRAHELYKAVAPKDNLKQIDLTRFVVEERIKRSYPQAWWAYNQAQTKEKLLFQRILQELAEHMIPFREKKKVGRPGLQEREKVFCMGLYCYGCFSSRRTISDLEIAKNAGLLSQTPHFNTMLNYLNDQSLTPYITNMIILSSLPLRTVEKHLAVDATGFSTSRFIRWLDIRTQKKSKKRAWKKAHLMIGTKTNIITSVEITDGFMNDCPYLIPLLDQTKIYFSMRTVSADKGYISRENYQAISDAGAIPFIPFKKNAIGNPKGYWIWRQMFDFFHNHREEFQKHYGRRQNVETTNSQIKRKFSNHLKAKKHPAQVNEILMKCLCHNICVLIQESFERGIDIDLNKCAEEFFKRKTG